MVGPSLAQQYFFRSYLTEGETPHLVVWDITQDEYGNLWFATTGGVSKFDGIEHTNYSIEEGLINNLVYDLLIDSYGYVWAATDGGVSIFDGQRFVNYAKKDGLPSDKIRTIAKDQNQRLWIGTVKGLVSAKIDGDNLNKITFRTYQLGGKHSNRVVHALTVDKSGNVWVGTETGLLKIKGEKKSQLTFTEFNESNGLTSNHVNALMCDEQGRIWVGTTKGISVLEDGEFAQLTPPDGIVHPIIKTFYEDEQGHIWVGTQEGVSKIDNAYTDQLKAIQPAHIKNYTESNGLCENDVLGIYQDFEGNHWFGTWGGGTCKFLGETFVSYTEQSGLCDDFVMSVFKDSRQNMWVGTYRGGVSRHQGPPCFNGPGQVQCFSMREGMNSNLVWAINEDKNGHIWFGTQGGLNKYDGKKIVDLSESARIDEAVRSIIKKNEVMWLGTQNGLVKYENQKFIHINVMQGGDDNLDIYPLFNDRNGNLWIGTYGKGVFKYNGKTFKQISVEDGLANNAVFSIAQDKQGNIWLGTLGGVTLYRPSKTGKGQISNFTKESGLSSNTVYTLIFDDSGNLWVGTNKGLDKMEVLEYYETGVMHFDNYTKEDGFTGVECNNNAVIKDMEDHLWFGTIDGLIKYNPDVYHENKVRPPINITGISVQYKDTTLPQGAKLNYYQNYLTFDYAGICFTNPDKVRYQFKLVGFHNQWSPVTKRRSATFSNLPPGDYTFKVRARNNEGVWSAQPVTFHFVIRTPFWQSWWFQTGIILLALLIAGSIYYVSLRNIQRRNTLNRKMDQLKLRALRAQMNPHFIFNAMNTIQHYINHNAKEAANYYLVKFADLMRWNLDHSQEPKVALSDLLASLELYLELEQLRFDPKFSYEIKVDDAIETDVTYLPPMLVQPYVENAIIHGLLNLTEENMYEVRKGKLQISFVLQNDYLICTIEDNGVGRKKAAELKEKKKDYGHKPTGMSITEERIRTLGELERSDFRVKVEDRLDKKGHVKGTRVILFIPEQMTWNKN